MIFTFGLVGAAQFTSGLGSNNNKDDKAQAGSSKPGEFELYLFAQSWAPRFCCTNAKVNAIETAHDPDDDDDNAQDNTHHRKT